jgi:uncharacterized protein YjiS (DUF1127 family)
MDRPLAPSQIPLCAAERVIRRQAFAFVLAQLALWWHRARGRRALARLSDRQLADIGISRVDARREAAKPFWRV